MRIETMKSKHKYLVMKTKHIKAFLGSWLIAAMLITIPVMTQASHDAGAEITYKHISGMTYEISITHYRDCSGLPAPFFMNFSYNSSSCSSTNSGSAVLDGSRSMELPGLCTMASTCSGGAVLGIERNVYKDTITLPMACADWAFSITSCCRNGGVTNLGSISASVYVEATLNNLAFPDNNSPTFNNLPTFMACNGSLFTTSYTSSEIDSDSIAYVFTDVLDGAGSAIPWGTGYSVTNQMSSSTTNALDAAGNFTATPNMLQNAQLAVKVEEWRAGVMVGSVTRDMGVWVVNCSNILPVAGFTHADTGLTITFTDTSSGATSWDWDFGDGSIDSVQNPVHTYASGGTYSVCLTVSNSCDVSTICQVIDVCPNGCVWPGDANNDGIANNFDIMNVGLAMLDTGAARPRASTAWFGQFCPEWADTFKTGLNHKFADCDGDGEVEPTENAVILANYGLTHSKGASSTGTGKTDGLYLDFAEDTTSSGETVALTLNLGDAANQANDVYGVALTIEYDNALVDSNGVTVDFGSSWLGNTLTTIDIQYDDYDGGRIEIGICRIDQTPVTGFGEIATVNIVIEDNIDGKKGTEYVLSCHINNDLVIDHNGDPITFGKSSDSVVISSVPGLGTAELLDQVSVYPNPATNQVRVAHTGFAPDRITLTDLLGRTISTDVAIQNDETVLDLTGLAHGVYLIHIEMDGFIGTKKLMVLNKLR
jgi:PKD repeat protein